MAFLMFNTNYNGMFTISRIVMVFFKTPRIVMTPFELTLIYRYIIYDGDVRRKSSPHASLLVKFTQLMCAFDFSFLHYLFDVSIH